METSTKADAVPPTSTKSLSTETSIYRRGEELGEGAFARVFAINKEHGFLNGAFCVKTMYHGKGCVRDARGELSDQTNPKYNGLAAH